MILQYKHITQCRVDPPLPKFADLLQSKTHNILRWYFWKERKKMFWPLRIMYQEPRYCFFKIQNNLAFEILWFSVLIDKSWQAFLTLCRIGNEFPTPQASLRCRTSSFGLSSWQPDQIGVYLTPHTRTVIKLSSF